MRIPLTPDLEIHLAAARCRQSGIDPRDIAERHRVPDDVHVIADGQIASPHHAAVAAPGRFRQIEVIRVHEDRIAEIEHRSRHVAELERRIGLGEAHFADAGESTNCVRIRYPREAQVRLHLTPPPSPRKSFTRAADLVIRTTQLEPDRAIELRPAQAVAGMPRQSESELPVVNLR